MFESHYGLRQDPFRLTPDPVFRYQHRSYQKAEAYIQYALRRGEGLVMVTGAPGLGKTTLVAGALADLDPGRTVVRSLVTTELAAADFLHMVAHAFGLAAADATKSEVLRQIEGFLDAQAQAGRRCILLVDEAQALGHGALEELRLLTNLQRSSQPLMQVLLLGHEELREIVRDPALEQLRQRLIAACHLEPLDDAETAGYIRHRLCVAGWAGVPRISGEGIRLVHRASGGVPRRVNNLMTRLLLHGSLEGHAELGEEDVRAVVDEVRAEGLLVSELDAGFSPGSASDSAPVEALAVEMCAAVREERAVVPTPPEPPVAGAEETSPVEPVASPGGPSDAAASEPAKSPAPPAASTDAGESVEAERADQPSRHAETNGEEKAGDEEAPQTMPEPSPVREVVSAGAVLCAPAPDAAQREARRRWPRVVALLAAGAGAAVLAPSDYWRATREVAQALPAWAAETMRELPVRILAQPAEPALTVIPTSRPEPVREDREPAGALSDEIDAEDAPGPLAGATPVPVPRLSGPEPTRPGSTARSHALATAPRGADLATAPIVERYEAVPTESPADPETRLDRLEHALASESLSPARVTAKAVRIRLGGDVSFAYGSADLTAQLAGALDRLAELLLQDALTRVRVVGHSDDVGAESVNLEMSRKRAAAVAGALIEHGLGPGRVSIEARGSSEPLLSNLTAAGRRENRRVELYLRVVEPEPVQISARSQREE